MRKNINGKIYDTENAEHIYGYINNVGDLDYIEEDLYRKTNGEFFKVGKGSPLSDYSWGYGGRRFAGGPTIIPLTDEEAKFFVEVHCKVEDYEKIFGEVDE